MKYLSTLLAIPVFLLSFSLMDQFDVDYTINNDFTMKILGTSNVHDWESTVEKLDGTAEISFGEDGSLKITECKVTIPVKSIKSTKGSIMDKKTWNALEATKHPNIVYRLTKFDKVTKLAAGFTSNATGQLSMAGVSKTISIQIAGTQLNNGSIEITGCKELKMTQFGIDPPTALMGAMTTGDDITIEFRIILNAK